MLKNLKIALTIILQVIFVKVYSQTDTLPFVLVLGNTQDGGYPHIGCGKMCCKKAFENKALKKNVVSLALVDPKEKKWWMFEATPDITQQLELFKKLTDSKYNYLPSGIFVTHAHIGHYAGLMYLGREALNAKEIPVFTLPRMNDFLKSNGPWSQLIFLKNIVLIPIKSDSTVKLSKNIKLSAFLVPHRDEFSETAGFNIVTSGKKYMFIPDIDKWEKWNKKIIEEVKKVDVALIDATFYEGAELPDRNIKDVPHPFVSETVELFKSEPDGVKKKIYFIHFNHTNPLLWDEEKQKELKKKGFNLAAETDKL